MVDLPIPLDMEALALWSTLLAQAAPAASTKVPNVFDYFWMSNLAGQTIVVVLFSMSAFAWSIMLGKWSEMQALRKANLALEKRLGQQPGIFSLPEAMVREAQGPYAGILRAALDGYRKGADLQMTLASRVSLMENAVQRAMAEVNAKYEDKLVLLGSVVQGGPFLGLLGTVWGVMDSFGNVAAMKNATIATLAPGVSGALLTTVAGLLVAIPSSFGFNYLLTRSKMMIVELENFASNLVDRIEIEARGYAAQEAAPVAEAEDPADPRSST